jgi:uncharacterized membrane protein
MRRNRRQTISGAIQLLGMLLGLTVAPVATPALIWATITADLPLALVILQLFIMAVMSNWLSHIAVRSCMLFEETRDDQTAGNPWSTEPLSG